MPASALGFGVTPVTQPMLAALHTLQMIGGLGGLLTLDGKVAKVVRLPAGYAVEAL